MANNENLKILSPSEARENGKKGGKASAKKYEVNNMSITIQEIECEIGNIESANVMLNKLQNNFDEMEKIDISYYIAGIESLLKFCRNNLENYVRRVYELIEE